MSKAEKFIQENTRTCSNELDSFQTKTGAWVDTYHEWITPDDALSAVEIAREEIYEWLTSHYRDYMHNPTGKKLEAFFGMDMITDLRKAMKDE